MALGMKISKGMHIWRVKRPVWCPADVAFRILRRRDEDLSKRLRVSLF